MSQADPGLGIGPGVVVERNLGRAVNDRPLPGHDDVEPRASELRLVSCPFQRLERRVRTVDAGDDPTEGGGLGIGHGIPPSRLTARRLTKQVVVPFGGGGITRGRALAYPGRETAPELEVMNTVAELWSRGAQPVMGF